MIQDKLTDISSILFKEKSETIYFGENKDFKEEEINALLSKDLLKLKDLLEHKPENIEEYSKTTHSKNIEVKEKIDLYWKENGVEGIRNLLGLSGKNDEIININNLNISQLVYIMNKYKTKKNEGGFESIVELYVKSNNIDFKSNSYVIETLCVSLNNKKKPEPEKTLKILSRLSEEEYNAELYGAKGKAYRQLYNQKLENGEKDIELLKKSQKSYEAGFNRFNEYYPGINASTIAFELGDFDKGHKLAEETFLSTIKDGGSLSSDYWCVSTMIQSAVLLKDDKFIEKYITNIDPIEYSIKEIIKMEKRGIEVADWQKDDAIKMLNNYLNADYIINDKKEKIKQALSLMEELKVAEIKIEKTPLDLLREKTYNMNIPSGFQGSNFIGGNVQFGGQLPSYSFSRKDWENFNNLLNIPLSNLLTKEELNTLEIKEKNKLSDIDFKDHNVFLNIIDTIIRKSFMTQERGLEDINGEKHKEYDNLVKNLLKTFGLEDYLKNSDLRWKVNTKTSLSASLLLGLGDCRHHAQSKQLFFDVWKYNKINQILNLIKENPSEQNYEKFNQLMSLSLVIYDTEVYANIKLNSGMYDPLKDTNGNKIYSETEQKIEEHTMNLLINEKTGKVYYSDSFYQNEYDWKSGEAILSIKEEKLEIDAKFIEVIDENSKNFVKTPVKLTPAVYAGKRESVHESEIGKMSILGINIDLNRNFEILFSEKCFQQIDYASKILYNKEEKPSENLTIG